MNSVYGVKTAFCYICNDEITPDDWNDYVILRRSKPEIVVICTLCRDALIPKDNVIYVPGYKRK